MLLLCSFCKSKEQCSKWIFTNTNLNNVITSYDVLYDRLAKQPAA